MTSESALARAAVDALPTELAVLDSDGVIVFTNEAWRSFGRENGLAGDPTSIGVDYLAVCEDSEDEWATRARSGIQALLAGERETFSFEYPCHSPDQQRWFTMRGRQFSTGG